jgi:hypothetical protein
MINDIRLDLHNKGESSISSQQFIDIVLEERPDWKYDRNIGTFIYRSTRWDTRKSRWSFVSNESLYILAIYHNYFGPIPLPMNGWSPRR